LGWNELTTRDVGAAKEFYPAVFGWELAPWTAGGTEYTVWNVDGQVIGGLMEMNDQWPARIPSHWMVYFMVADADATATLAQELGGTISIAAFDVPGIGRITVLNDPHRAAFSVLTPATQPEQ
jgi:uncharacterized protein